VEVDYRREPPGGVLEAAEPAQKAALYESLGLSLTYEPSERRVLVEADLNGVRSVRVGGPRTPKCHLQSGS
jgi:hypothetical protein